MNRERNKLTPDILKYFIFIRELTALKDIEIRSRLQSKLEQDSKLTLQIIVEEYQRITILRHDTAKIGERDISHIHYVEKKEHGKKRFSFKINPCYKYGQIHLHKKLPI